MKILPISSLRNVSTYTYYVCLLLQINGKNRNVPRGSPHISAFLNSVHHSPKKCSRLSISLKGEDCLRWLRKQIISMITLRKGDALGINYSSEHGYNLVVTCKHCWMYYVTLHFQAMSTEKPMNLWHFHKFIDWLKKVLTESLQLILKFHQGQGLIKCNKIYFEARTVRSRLKLAWTQPEGPAGSSSGRGQTTKFRKFWRWPWGKVAERGEEEKEGDESLGWVALVEDRHSKQYHVIALTPCILGDCLPLSFRFLLVQSNVTLLSLSHPYYFTSTVTEPQQNLRKPASWKWVNVKFCVRL